jgi:Ca-activated chloride channel family protein
MAESDFDWEGQTITRLDAVKKVFRLFVAGGETNDGTTFPGRPQDLIGLVTFASRPESPCPLTLSHSVLLRLLDEARPRTVPGEAETNVSDALVLAMHRLDSAGSRRKVMVLLSDGEHNVPHPSSGFTPRQAAQVAANLGVRIYTIDAGSDRPAGPDREKTSPHPMNRAEGQRILKEIAHIAQGQYFSARDTSSLLTVLREIDSLERQQIQSFQYRRFHEGYPWVALGGLLSLVILLTLEFTVWQRIP